MAKFSKLNAATINWENIDHTNVVEIADKHWILSELVIDDRQEIIHGSAVHH